LLEQLGVAVHADYLKPDTVVVRGYSLAQASDAKTICTAEVFIP
jgi:hypothetical protein